MVKKKRDVSEYVSAREAASILSDRLGRSIRPDYIHRMKKLTRIEVQPRMFLYLRSSVESATIRQKGTNEESTTQQRTDNEEANE